MNFKFELYGSACNGYPLLTVAHNNKVVYSDAIVENQTVELDLLPAQTNLISLSGIGKKNGENGLWDTVIDKHNQVVQDKYLVVKNILIDNIPMGHDWIKTLRFESLHDNDSVFLGWWQNDSVSFTVELPLLDWIIEQKFMNNHPTTGSDINARSGDARFDYDYIQDKIAAIKKIISD